MSEAAAAATRTFTSWKLDVMNTANADPLLAKYDAAFRMLVLAMTFVRQDDRTCYVTNTTARVRACIKTDATASAARKKLIEFGYFTDTGKRTKDGATVFEVKNPNQERVAEHIILATEALKERETFRKQEERRKQRLKRQMAMPSNEVVPSTTEDPKALMPFSDRRDSPSVIEGKHLETTPRNYSHRKGGLSSDLGFRDTWGVREPVLRPFSEIQANRGAK